MAITFSEKTPLEERKRLRFLIPILVIVLSITIFVLWQGYFGGEEPIIMETPTFPSFKKVEINYQIFDDPIFDKLQPFEGVPSFEETPGRENPFLPYE